MALLTKKRIDIGSKGTATTGDILYIGGEKINNNDDALFNAFGDQRLFKAANGVDSQVLHATGYYQKLEMSDYANPVDPGSMHDMNTLNGTIMVALPSNPKVGEGVVFINSNGSFSTARQLIVNPGTNTIKGLTKELSVTKPFARVMIWCISSSGGKAVWDYNMESMFGNKYIPLETSLSLVAKERIAIGPKLEYDQITLNIFARTPTSSNIKSCSIHVAVDAVNNEVHSTEYAVIRKKDGKTEKDLFETRFFIEADVIYVEVTPAENIRIALKAVNTLRIGDTV